MNELIPFSDLEKMATVMGKNKMFGKSSEELLPLFLIAQAEGKHPAIAAQEYDIIQGKPAINSKSALARFQSAGGKVEWVERTDKKASAIFTHVQGGSLKVEWTIDRAAQAGLSSKDNWRKYPTQMLSARCISEGVRAVFPACLSGMYTVEEVQDFDGPQVRNVTPQRITIADELDQQAEVFEKVFNPAKDRLVKIRNRFDANIQDSGKEWLDKLIEQNDTDTDWNAVADKVLDGLKARGIDTSEKESE